MEHTNKRCFRRIALLAFSAALVHTSCSGTPKPSPAPTLQPAAATPEPTLNLSVYIDDESWGEKSWGDDIVSREIMRLQNVSMSIRKPSGYADSSAQLNLMEMSGEFPDLMVLPADMRAYRLMRRGAFLELNKLIQEQGENIRKNIETLDYLPRYCAYEGKVYALPYSTQSAAGMVGIHGVLVLQGLYVQMGSPRLSSFDDLYEYLLRLRQEQVYNRSGKLIYPSTLDDPAPTLAAALGARAVTIFGLTFVREEDGRFRHLLRTATGRSVYAFLNLLHRNKLIDPDWMMKTKTDSLQKLLDGGIGVYFCDDAARWTDQYNRLLFNQSGDSFQQVLLLGDGTDGAYTSNFRSKRPDHFLCVGRNTQDPGRVFAFLDWMASSEGQYVSLLGPEGTIWERSAGSIPVLTEDFRLRNDANDSELLRELNNNKWSLLHIDRFHQDVLNAVLTEPSAASHDNTVAALKKGFWTVPGLESAYIDPATEAGYAGNSILTYIRQTENQLYMDPDPESFDRLYDTALAQLELLNVEELENAVNVSLGFTDIHAFETEFYELPGAEE